ncbi:MAG: class B sortase [Eggerthellaceae bacterium]
MRDLERKNTLARAVLGNLPVLGFFLSALALAAALLFLASLHHDAAHTDPSPFIEVEKEGDGFPVIDWEYWLSINPDVIGWITIPGTPVDYPIVQAPANNPQYYLTHDVFGKWNYMGCPYLDARCSEAGLEESPNAVVFGHNLGYGDPSMFAAIADFLDAGFAESHGEILLQTPRRKMRFEALGALCTDGGIPTKRTDFENRKDLGDWLAERLGECQVIVGRPSPEPCRILTLCTCSYNRLENERTILFAERK